MARPPIVDINQIPGLVGLGPLPSAAPVAPFAPEAIQNLIDTKGFVAYHFKHCYNPDRGSIDAPVNPNSQAATRGLIYYEVREVRVVPQQFSMEERLTAQSIFNIGAVLFNVSGHYHDGDRSQAHISQRDLIMFNPTFTDIQREMIEYNPTGINQLKFKAKGIDLIMGKNGKKYTDFTLQDGKIVWGNDVPSFIAGKGEVLSVVYWFNPIYVVKQMLHSLRVIPGNASGLGSLPREATYMPQQLVAMPTWIQEEDDILDWTALPQIPEYRDWNTTGG